MAKDLSSARRSAAALGSPAGLVYTNAPPNYAIGVAKCDFVSPRAFMYPLRIRFARLKGFMRELSSKQLMT